MNPALSPPASPLLPSPPILRWPAEALWQSVVPLLPGFTVEVLPEVDSTNSELMRRARAGRCEPVLLVAEQQSAGRGRMGKHWSASSHAGQSLTFSLGLPLVVRDWSGLSLVVGLALAECLNPAVQIKWPNDLWLDGGRKLCGILIETASTTALGVTSEAGAALGEAASAAARYVVIGVGINIVAPAVCVDAANRPAGWCEVEPHANAPELLERVLLPLVQAVQGFAITGFAPYVQRYSQRDALRGRQVLLSDGRQGCCQGVGADGALWVQFEGDSGPAQAITSAQVSVRPSLSTHAPAPDAMG